MYFLSFVIYNWRWKEVIEYYRSDIILCSVELLFDLLFILKQVPIYAYQNIQKMFTT